MIKIKHSVAGVLAALSLSAHADMTCATWQSASNAPGVVFTRTLAVVYAFGIAQGYAQALVEHGLLSTQPFGNAPGQMGSQETEKIVDAGCRIYPEHGVWNALALVIEARATDEVAKRKSTPPAKSRAKP